MVALDSVKHAALCKMVDYLFEDPETRFPKAMEMVDKAAPRNLFPSQREAFRNAIDEKNNWYQLLMKIAHLNPDVRNRLVKSFLIDSNLMVWGEQGEESRQIPVQHSVGDSARSHERVQPTLHGLLGCGIRP